MNESQKYHSTSWTEVVTPKNKWYQLNLGEIVRYKDLLFLFVRRDFVAQFKQTVLGPVWFLIQPILQALTMYVVFNLFGGLSTDGLPAMLFYLSGTILWLYFSECLVTNSNTFTSNAGIYGKVYFPRLIVPLSVVVSNLFKFGIRLVLFLAVFSYYYFFTDAQIEFSSKIWVVIPLVVLMAGYGFSLGIFFSSLSTKYRDFKFLLGFGVQLLMYASSVVLPFSQVEDKLSELFNGQYIWLARINPFVNIIEAFKYITMGKGEFSWIWLGYSFALLIVITFLALIIFKRTERNFMDTV